MPRSSTVISTRAYLKLVLHAAKYQSRAVMGLLVAQPAAAAAASSSGGASQSAGVLVTDVLPLFHTTPLSPMIEVALSHAEAFVRASYPSGTFLAGLYYAPELFEPKLNSVNEAVLPMPQANVVVKMAEKIAANGGALAGSRILLLDNVRLGALGASNSESTHSALESFECRSSSKTWSSTGSVTLEAASAAGAEESLDGAVAALRSILASDQQRVLCDFDDHLDDAKADWTNKELENKVLPTLAK